MHQTDTKDTSGNELLQKAIKALEMALNETLRNIVEQAQATE